MMTVMDRMTERGIAAALPPGLRRRQAFGLDGAAIEPIGGRGKDVSLTRLMSVDPEVFAGRQTQPEGE